VINAFYIVFLGIVPSVALVSLFVYYIKRNPVFLKKPRSKMYVPGYLSNAWPVLTSSTSPGNRKKPYSSTNSLKAPPEPREVEEEHLYEEIPPSQEPMYSEVYTPRYELCEPPRKPPHPPHASVHKRVPPRALSSDSTRPTITKSKLIYTTNVQLHAYLASRDPSNDF
jgi:hypothetical protein